MILEEATSVETQGRVSRDLIADSLCFSLHSASAGAGSEHRARFDSGEGPEGL